MDLSETQPETFLAESMSSAKDAAALREQLGRLREELRTAMLEGDAAGVIRLQGLIRELPDRILAADLAAIKSELDAVEASFAELKSNERDLIELKREKSAILKPILEEMEKAGLEVEKVNFALDLLRFEREGLHERRRELKARLAERMAEVEKEVNRND